jgi:hypothetical protein
MTGTEKHYSVAEVAELWSLSDTTVTRLFRDQPGVVRLSCPTLLKTRKRRSRVTLRIPESVIQRVHQSLQGGQSATC